MIESCLPSQMTGFDTYFLLLKVKVDTPYQKVIDCDYYFRKAVSLICSLCLCVMVIPLYWQYTFAL